MAKILGSPSRYIQSPGAASMLGALAAEYSPTALILIDPVLDGVVPILNNSFAKSGTEYYTAAFGGECSPSEINRVREIVRNHKCGVVIGMGGGKALDTAKAVAYYEHMPVLIAPSAASSDAPCSALAVVYTEDHIFKEYLHLPSNPDAVICDTTIIASAPPRLLAAGIGDALATYFEARAVKASHAKNCLGGDVTETAMSIATLCRDTVLNDGLNALITSAAGAVTPAFERLVEANIYMSGVGFESGGLAAAHAIHDGLTVLPGTHAMLHGEKVAFGLIAMLVMEGAREEELNEIVDFCINTGLPVTFEELGIANPSHEDLIKVAERAASPDDTAHNMPFPVTPETIYNALVGADAIGRLLSGADDESDCCAHEHHHDE